MDSMLYISTKCIQRAGGDQKLENVADVIDELPLCVRKGKKSEDIKEVRTGHV